MKFDCEKCGKIDEARFDGYGQGAFPDLQGITFVVTKNDKGKCKVRTLNDNDQADARIWMSVVKRWAEQNDVFDCPKCGGQVVPDDMLPEA